MNKRSRDDLAVLSLAARFRVIVPGTKEGDGIQEGAYYRLSKKGLRKMRLLVRRGVLSQELLEEYRSKEFWQASDKAKELFAKKHGR